MIISEFFAGGMMIAFSLAGIVYVITNNLVWSRWVGFACIGICIGCILISLIGEYIYNKKEGVKDKKGMLN